MSEYLLSARSKKNREGVDSRLIEISDLAITITTIDFGHGSTAGLRNASLQKKLFDNGKSKCDGTIVKSYHQTGKALDFYAYIDGNASWERAHLAEVACAFLQAASQLGYKIEWGGLWPWDAPHIQLSED